MSAKVCPRCGEQYENLKSVTCPQCFARLLVVDEATAEELAAARASVVQTPEFQAVKEEDDERFRQQSFGACLGVVTITLATLVLIVVLLVVAVHRYGYSKPKTVIAALPDEVGNANALTPLPVATAALADVMPDKVEASDPAKQSRDGFHLQKRDQTLVVPGTLTPIFHAIYTSDSAGSDNIVNVYAIPLNSPTTTQNQFRLGVTLAAQLGAAAPGHTCLIFSTEHWLYGAIGSVDPTSFGNPDGFQRGLIAHFRQLEH